MGRQTRCHSRQEGFAVVQFFVVIAIVLVVVGMAVPVYAAKAKHSVLEQNARSLALEAKSCLALDLDPTYAPGDAAAGIITTSTAKSVSSAIEAALRDGRAGGASGRYVNPTSGSETIVNQTALPTSAGVSRPAVWITDDQACSYARFAGSDDTKAHLAGTLVVAFVTFKGSPSGIDVFFVDASGVKSPTITTLAI